MELFQDIGNFLSPYFKSLYVQIASLILFATFHGYAGAWLAVRMLFRPRRPFKVAGLTLFPQGMIPRHRDRLANAIGKAVGEELVSQETIMEELVGKEFLRKKIRGVVDAYTHELLSRSYPSLIESLPGNMRATLIETIASLQLKIAEHIDAVLKSEESRAAVSAFVERRADDLLSRRVRTIVDDEMFEKIVRFLESRIGEALRSPILEEKVREFISRRIDDLAAADTPLRQMFTPDAVALLKEKAGEQIAPMTHHLTEIAAAERTRSQIGTLIKRELHQYYENLPFFKKIFVSRDNLLKEVDDLVNESLPKRIEETLKGDFFAGEAQAFIDSSIDGALSRPIADVVGKIDPDQLERFKRQIANAVLSLVRGDAVMRSASAYVTDTLARFRPHSIDSILRSLHPESKQKLKDMLSRSLLAVIARDNTSKAVNDMLSRQIENLLAAPIGRLSDRFPEEKLREASESFADTVIAAIREKLPDAIREFNIGGVVREKIMNYPEEKLEALVMSVAKEHLRTIELFGALFGFLIGIAQSVQFYLFAR